MNSKHAPPILVGFFAFCAAAVVGWKLEPSTTAEPASQNSDNSSRARQHSSADQPLRNLRAQRVEGHRMRTAIEMARNLPSSEIKEWLESGKFNHREGFAMTLFQKIVFERWSQEEPVEFLSWVAANGSSGHNKHVLALFEKHPDAVREVLATLDNPGHKNRLIDKLAKTQPDLALSEIKKLLADNPKSSEKFYSIFEKLIKTRPGELEKMLTEIDGPARTSLESVIIKRDLAEDFEGTLDQLLQLENGHEHILGNYHYQNQNLIKPEILLARLGEFPPEWKTYLTSNSHYFFNFVKTIDQFSGIDFQGAGFTEQQTHKLTQDFLSRIVQKKPEQIFADLENYQLSENGKRNVFRSVMRQNHSEEKLADIRSNLTQPEDRSIFDELAEKSSASTNKPIKTPGDLLATLSDGNIPGDPHFLFSWEPEQKRELAKSFQTLEGADKSRLAGFIASTNNHFSLEIRGEAIEHLLTTPELPEFLNWQEHNRRGVGNAVSGHALSLMKSDSSKATSWVATLPEGPVRLQTQKNLAYNWRNYEPEAARKWVESLPESQKAEVSKFLESN